MKGHMLILCLVTVSVSCTCLFVTMCEKVTKMKNRAERPPTFALEISGNAEVKASIKEKKSVVKETMTAVLQQKVINADVLEEVLKYWIREKNQKFHSATSTNNTKSVYTAS